MTGGGIEVPDLDVDKPRLFIGRGSASAPQHAVDSVVALRLIGIQITPFRHRQGCGPLREILVEEGGHLVDFIFAWHPRLRLAFPDSPAACGACVLCIKRRALDHHLQCATTPPHVATQ